mgnify:CR=1 FL=1
MAHGRDVKNLDEVITDIESRLDEKDEVRGYLSAYDVNAPRWGSTAERWWTYFDARPSLAGGRDGLADLVRVGHGFDGNEIRARLGERQRGPRQLEHAAAGERTGH